MSEQGGDQPERPPQRRDFRNFESLIDKLIGEAQAQGQFDELAGAGRPINTSDDLNVPEEQRLGFRMLKTHGFAPPWIEARRDIERERARVEAWLRSANGRWPSMHDAQRASARVEYRALLRDLRRMILDYNLTAPPAAGQIEGLNMDAELARLGAGG